MQTTEPMSPGELLISAPNHMLFATKTMNCPELQPIFDAHPEAFGSDVREFEENKTIVRMLWEMSKGPESFWHEFFKTMPADVEILTDWGEFELLELQDSMLVADNDVRRSREHHIFKLIHEALLKFPDVFNPSDVTFEKIHWTSKILTTRAFGKCTPYGALVPIADFVNHGNIYTNYYYGSAEDPPPDVDMEDKESGDEDQDEPLVGPSSVVNLTWQKLFRMNVAAQTDLSEEVTAELLKQARALDAKKFVESKA